MERLAFLMAMVSALTAWGVIVAQKIELSKLKSRINDIEIICSPEQKSVKSKLPEEGK